MSALQHIMRVLPISVMLVAQCACAAAASKSNSFEESEAYYSRAASLFRTTTLASEAEFNNLIGAEYEGARLTILRDFRKQTQVQVLRVRDDKGFDEVYLETRFATSGFGAPSDEMKDGSTKSSANVDSYLIRITAEEFTETMSALRSMADLSANSSGKRSGEDFCLHAAGAFFESIEANDRVLVSRSGCDDDFGVVVLKTAPLFDFAVRKIPSAIRDFDFARSLFDEVRKEKKSEH